MPVLRTGSKGPQVKELQTLLKEKGYSISTDGIYGPRTENAVRLFQQKSGLNVDGITGRRTLQALGKTVTERAPAPPVGGSVERQPCAGMNMSQSGFETLFKLEAQPNVSNHLHWPKGASGVTLGPGYDMKERSAASVKSQLLALGLSNDVAEKASAGAGKSGHDARAFAKDNKYLIDLTAEQEKQLLRLTLPSYVASVRNRITVPLRQYEFDALVCFAYNPATFLSKVCNYINNGQVSDAMTLISQIVMSGGDRLKGLVERRRTEVNLYLNGKYL